MREIKSSWKFVCYFVK